MKNKKEVIKASAAIQISNNVNLLQRKSWNILLANAFDELELRDEFTIKIKDLCNLLKYKGNNDSHIKKLVRDLQSITVEWNLLGKDLNEWGRSVLLSGVIIRNGYLSYAYDPILKKKLHNPSMYARISLSFQNDFKSKYSLALYELFVDYFVEKKSYGETPYIAIDKFRELLGLKETEYNEFKYLNNYIIKKSVKEINDKSNLFVEIKYEKSGRNIVSLKFIIRKNPNNNTNNNTILDVLEMPKIEHKALTTKEFEIDNKELFSVLLNEFGISKNKAVDILITKDELYIEENLAIVRKKVEEGKVKNISAYTVRALEEDFRSITPKFEIEEPKKKNNLLDKIMSFGIAESIAKKVLENKTEKEILSDVKYINKNKGNKENLSGYAVKILKDRVMSNEEIKQQEYKIIQRKKEDTERLNIDYEIYIERKLKVYKDSLPTEELKSIRQRAKDEVKRKLESGEIGKNRFGRYGFYEIYAENRILQKKIKILSKKEFLEKNKTIYRYAEIT